MVIIPLQLATENVLEYYLSEEKQEGGNVLGSGSKNSGSLRLQHNLNRFSAGGGSTSKTAVDDAGTQLSDYDSSELSKVKRRLMKLDINSQDEQLSSSGKKYESPKSHKTLKKRRFRLLETHEVGEDIFSSSVESSS